MITYKLKINFQDPRVLTSDMEFVTGDVGAYRLECEFYDNGQPAEVSGLLLSVKAKRADGAVFTDSGEMEGGKGVYVLKNEMYAIAGGLYLEIALSDSAENYVTAKIITANVLQGLAEGDPAEDDVSVYVTLLSQMKAQLDEANALIDEANELIDEAQISFDEQFAQLESELSQKADKKTSGGGFVGGNGASASSGGAAGNGASSEAGGAVGNMADTDDGFAGGNHSKAANGGGAAGANAKTNAGGAVGLGAMAYNYGGAVGNGATAGEGFSGGYNAKAATMEGYSQRYIDAIQLGTGTNQNEKTLQVYDHQLMDANGKIPLEALNGKLIQEIHVPLEEADQVRDNLSIPGLYLFIGTDMWAHISEALLVVNQVFTPSVMQYRFGDDGTIECRTVNYSNGTEPSATEWESFSKTSDLEAAVSAANLWGGNVSDWSQLPENPKAGTYCYVENDILTGVKYTGKVSSLFRFNSDYFPYVDGVNFDVDEKYIQPVEASGYTGLLCIYDSVGVKKGTLEYGLTSSPGSFSVSALGAESIDDTVTFYLGVYNGENFPSKIESFPADSMIFWNGTKWCCVPCAGSDA